jgi:aldehyde dehydrogenase (NAD+)
MNDVLSKLGILAENPGAFGAAAINDSAASLLASFSPIDEKELARVQVASEASYERVLSELQAAFIKWRKVPAPQRGLLVRDIAEALRKRKNELGRLVTLECGKILPEGEGEIQEAIDIADFAVGLSRQLYGLTMHSERPLHRMYEQWHPLGIIGVVTAFNFPAAVWAWNSLLAVVCGNTVLWKPSEHTPLVAIAMHQICAEVAAAHGHAGIFGLVVGDGPVLGKKIAADVRVPLVSATGSCQMGKSVAEVVGRRLGRTLLELGGNNAIVVLRDANMELVVRSTLFGAVGTAGQRCTSTRRVLIDKSIEQDFINRMTKAYSSIRIGNPLDSGVLMGPLINTRAVESYHKALEAARAQGAEIICGGKSKVGMLSSLYVEPAIVRARNDMPIVQEETFAPILYVIPVDGVEDAIRQNNGVKQGLSSAIFTRNLQDAEAFLGAEGSDCGIANVNLGTSGAEIGGAFGGEKETGGGRESGSDSWRAYMRRQTNTINYGNQLPLAQGIRFDV